MGKIIPAAILFVTAYQLLSDRDTLFGGPKPVVWSPPSTDSSDGSGSTAAAASKVSGAPAQEGGGDPAKLPEGYKPVVAQPCRCANV